MSEYLWLIYAILSAVAAALVSVFGKIGLQGVDSGTATVIRAVVMALFLIGVMVVQKAYGHLGAVLSNKRAMLFIVISGIAGAVSWLFYFVALKYGKVSQVAPVDKLSVVLATLIAVVFLGEHVSAVGIGGVVMITIGIIMVALG